MVEQDENQVFWLDTVEELEEVEEWVERLYPADRGRSTKIHPIKLGVYFGELIHLIEKEKKEYNKRFARNYHNFKGAQYRLKVLYGIIDTLCLLYMPNFLNMPKNSGFISTTFERKDSTENYLSFLISYRFPPGQYGVEEVEEYYKVGVRGDVRGLIIKVSGPNQGNILYEIEKLLGDRLSRTVEKINPAKVKLSAKVREGAPVVNDPLVVKTRSKKTRKVLEGYEDPITVKALPKNKRKVLEDHQIFTPTIRFNCHE
jgi:hypothetical protein